MAYRGKENFKKSPLKPHVRIQNNLAEMVNGVPSTTIAKNEFDLSTTWPPEGVVSFPYVPILETLKVFSKTDGLN